MSFDELSGRLVVVKVGGSLFGMPDLGARLESWLTWLRSELPERGIILVPGGGPTTDAIRTLDQARGLGEETSHWLALRALTINAHVLAALLPSGGRVSAEPATDFVTDFVTVVDPYAFACADEGRPGCLPHTWQATSDSVAARIAVVAGAPELILLKSAAPPESTDWREASRQGYVDAHFHEVLQNASHPLRVRAVNLRTWQRSPNRGIETDGVRDQR